MTGCLVTDKAELEQEENFPPSIESQTGMDVEHPLDEVIIFNQDEEAFDGELELDVIVRDPNVDQELILQTFVDGAGRIGFDSLPGDGEVERRRNVFVEEGLFSQEGCRRIDLLVSSDFQLGNLRKPTEPGDIGTARWWVFTRPAAAEEINPSICPGQP
ncbi:MAG: hypothetical protein ACOCUS_04685 [Polyangiales bacterium]